MLTFIDQQIAHAQSFGIDPGNDELLHTIANLLCDLYESREQLQTQLSLEPIDYSETGRRL